MQAVLFTLRLESPPDHLAGLALVCADARYISIRLPQAERLERRFAVAQDWPTIIRELSDLTADALPKSSRLRSIIAGEWPVEVRYVTAQDVGEPVPTLIVETLDSLLKAQPIEPPALRLRQSRS